MIGGELRHWRIPELLRHNLPPKPDANKYTKQEFLTKLLE